MAKKKKDKKQERIDANYDIGIVEENIADACKGYMQIYGANNNLMRHLPEVLDGLLIGERRILYTMYKKGIRHDGPTVKVKSIVGDCMKYHPHGESTEGTLVKLAQPWNNIHCCVVGKGNFGSAAGDTAASGRYIEAKLSFYAYKCFFEEFSTKIVSMRRNYLDNDYEPVYLPAKYPNVLFNPVFGIGFGIATYIPTYNFKESCEAAITLIKDPDADIVLIPDSCTGASIVDEGRFPEISKTGKGTFKMRARIEIDEERHALILTSTPYLAYWHKSKEKIIKILNNGKTNMLINIKDESEMGIMRFVLMIQPEVDLHAALDLIYSRTEMEKTFPVQFNLTEKYNSLIYNIKSILLTWIDFRRETKRRYYCHELVEAKERESELLVILKVLEGDNAERTATIIKTSENNSETISRLMKTYDINSLQAKTITELKMGMLTKAGYKKFKEELNVIRERIDKVQKIIRKPKKIDNIIIEELEEGIRLFGDDRRSQIMAIDNIPKIRNTEHLLAFTANGMVKKLPSTLFGIGDIASNDKVLTVLKMGNLMNVLVFDTSGKCFKIPVSKIDNSTLKSVGHKISDYCKLTGNVVSVYPYMDDDMLKEYYNTKINPFYIMVSKNGMIKKCPASAFSNMRSELIAMMLKTNDTLVACIPKGVDGDILIYTDGGMMSRYNTDTISETGRLSTGCSAMQLDESDTIRGIIGNLRDKDYIVTLTTSGLIKKMPINCIADKGKKAMRLLGVTERDRLMDVFTVSSEPDYPIFTVYTNTKNKYDITIEDIPELPRLSRGGRLKNMPKSEYIVKLEELS